MPASQPPPLPGPGKTFRRAMLLNFFLPGAGLIYAGRPITGWFYSITFSGCFLAALLIFIIGYARYIQLATSSSLMAGNELENLAGLFHPRWLLTLLGIGILALLLSTLSLLSTRSRLK